MSASWSHEWEVHVSNPATKVSEKRTDQFKLSLTYILWLVVAECFTFQCNVSLLPISKNAMTLLLQNSLVKQTAITVPVETVEYCLWNLSDSNMYTNNKQTCVTCLKAVEKHFHIAIHGSLYYILVVLCNHNYCTCAEQHVTDSILLWKPSWELPDVMLSCRYFLQNLDCIHRCIHKYMPPLWPSG